MGRVDGEEKCCNRRQFPCVGMGSDDRNSLGLCGAWGAVSHSISRNDAHLKGELGDPSIAITGVQSEVSVSSVIAMSKDLVSRTEDLETNLATPRKFGKLQQMIAAYQRRFAPSPHSPLIHLVPVVIGAVAVGAALVTLYPPRFAQSWQHQVQTAFFDLRGAVPLPPATPDRPAIVILAMDGETMTQGTQIYAAEPEAYPEFAPIQRWPWQRTAYAMVIDRLLQAGARAVVLDVVLDAPSSYGVADDAALQRVLAKYPGRVALAAKYEDQATERGYELTLFTPHTRFEQTAPAIGFINFLLSGDGRIHQLGGEFLRQVQQDSGELGTAIPQVPSLAEAALQAARVDYDPPVGQDLFFWGPSQTFEHVPFWHVLDRHNWTDYHLKNQTFKDKIVLIGPTGGGESFQDFHAAPFSATWRYPEKMPGVEIQATAIATLMHNRAIAPLLPTAWAEALLVGGVVLGAGAFAQWLPGRARYRFLYGLAIALGWGGLSYGVFVGAQRMLPTVVPIAAIGLSSTVCLLLHIKSDKIVHRKFLKRVAIVPEVQSAASEFPHHEVQAVIEQQQREFVGSKLDGRYQVMERIGTGGFGETYKALDLKRPGTPFCVVKRLRPVNPTPRILQLAERLFNREAEVLEQLGTHDQIPQLLAYFQEADEFYLVQEYIDGLSLADEVTLLHRKLNRPLSEQTVVLILYELLQILDFVHSQGVIHRDIKPANVIRRRSDRKLVLIDFGAVKQVRMVLEDEEPPLETVLSVAIGTTGYSAPEQLMGKPCPASDIFSLGMMGIRALTGIEPSKLIDHHDPLRPRLRWKEHVQVSEALMTVLETMIAVDVQRRYPTARAAMAALAPLVAFAARSQPASPPPAAATGDRAVDSDADSAGANLTNAETKPWDSESPSLGLLPVTDSDDSEVDVMAETREWMSGEISLPDTTADSQANRGEMAIAPLGDEDEAETPTAIAPDFAGDAVDGSATADHESQPPLPNA